MATTPANHSAGGQPLIADGVVLSDGQTGTGDSDNTLDRRGLTGPALLMVTTDDLGASQSVTFDIRGSADDDSDPTHWFNVPYCLPATPDTSAIAAVTIDDSGGTTKLYLLRAGFPWRFLKLVYSASVQTEVTATVFPFRS